MLSKTSDVPLGLVKKPLSERLAEFKEIVNGDAATEEKNEPEINTLKHLNEAENPQLAGKPVNVEAVVSSTSTSYIIPKKIYAETKISDDNPEGSLIVTFPLDDPRNLTFVAVRDETRDNRLKKLFKGDIFKIETRSYRTVYMVRIRPPVNSLIKKGSELVDDQGYEYKYLDLYIATDKPLSFQPSTLIKITALPLPHPRSQKTTLLAYDIEFPEKVENFDTEKLDCLRAKFEGKTPIERLTWILDNTELYTRIIGRRNIAEASLLIMFTPTYVELFGEKQRGWGLSDVIGDSTVGKSETVKKLLQLLRAGMYISAETASIVGLVGTATQIESEGWFIDWGFLPLMDRKLLAMDGCDKLNSAQWSVTAEAERSGEVAITKAAKGNAYARTRQIKIFNPVDKEADKYTTKVMSEFLYPILALATVEDKKIIARRDIAVFADQRDVTPEQINKRLVADPEPELQYLAEALKFSWMEKAKVEWTNEALDYLLKKATDLFNNFFYDYIPLVNPEIKWKLARLSVAMAKLTLSVTDDYSKVWVTLEHVALVCEFLEREYSAAGLNVLAQTKRMERLTTEDVKRIFENICAKITKSPIGVDDLCRILEFILLSGGTTKAQIQTEFELTETNQMRPLTAALQTEGLINIKRGYYPSAKLVEAYKATDNFTTITTFNTVPEGYPTKDFTTNKNSKLSINEAEAGQSTSDGGKYIDSRNKENAPSNRDSGKHGKRGKNYDDCNKLLCKHPTPDKIEDKSIAESCPDFTENCDDSGDYSEPGESMEEF